MIAEDIYQYYPPRPGNGGNLDIVGTNFGKDPEEWVFQPKVNGERIIVHTPTGTVFNRHGSRYSADKCLKISKAVDNICEKIDHEWVDCEALTCKGNFDGVVVVLDVFMEDATLEERRKYLSGLFPLLPLHNIKESRAYLIPQFPWRNVRRHWNKLQEDPTLYEGVVAKMVGSPYEPNYDSPTKQTIYWRKHRFLN